MKQGGVRENAADQEVREEPHLYKVKPLVVSKRVLAISTRFNHYTLSPFLPCFGGRRPVPTDGLFAAP
jgi:hypothetical protein